MIVLEPVAVFPLQFAATGAAVVDGDLELGALDVTLPVRPAGPHQHHLHTPHADLLGDAVV